MDELEKKIKKLTRDLDSKEREVHSAEYRAAYWREEYSNKSIMYNRLLKNQGQIKSAKGIKGSEAEEAFEPFRKDIAKRIVASPLTTENALIIARRAFITGYKKARE